MQGGRQVKRTHCKKGHALTGKNVYVTPGGARLCLICRDSFSKVTARRQKAKRQAYKPMRAALEAIERILNQELWKYRGNPGLTKLIEVRELAEAALEEVREEEEKANA
jgi:hypothetical protein